MCHIPIYVNFLNMQEEKQCGQHQEPSYKSRKVYKWIVCDLLNLKTREFMNNLPELTYL